LVWEKINEPSDYRLLYGSRTKPLNPIEIGNCQNIYDAILDQIMAEFYPKDYIELLKEEVQVELMLWNALNGGDRMDVTIANVERANLEKKKQALAEKAKKTDVKKNLVLIQKSGIQLPSFHNISILDYYTYLNYGE
jgi:hypothetical protein